MPKYRRPKIAGATVFLTIATHRRHRLFSEPKHVALLRATIRQVRCEFPFEVTAAVVLPDHLHFLWTLPPGVEDYSSRVGRMKALFTKSLRATSTGSDKVSESRRRHRERDIWQRRFWDHVIRDDDDLAHHIDYIHFNPVKHGLAKCPHAWPYSSFHKWVKRGGYEAIWACACCGEAMVPDFGYAAENAGE
jgi:REP-associated tyrosine transposase